MRAAVGLAAGSGSGDGDSTASGVEESGVVSLWFGVIGSSAQFEVYTECYEYDDLGYPSLLCAQFGIPDSHSHVGNLARRTVPTVAWQASRCVCRLTAVLGAG